MRRVRPPSKCREDSRSQSGIRSTREALLMTTTPRYELVRCMDDVHRLRPYPSVAEWRALRIRLGLNPDPLWIAQSYHEAVEQESELVDAGREGGCPTCGCTLYYTRAGEDHAALACWDCARSARRQRRDEAEKAEREALKAAGKITYIHWHGWVETDPPEWLEAAKLAADEARKKWEQECLCVACCRATGREPSAAALAEEAEERAERAAKRAARRSNNAAE